MSLRAWSTTSQTPILTPASEAETSLTALDFLAALVSTPLRLYRPIDLNLTGFSLRRAGHGGHAVIEIGFTRHPKKRLVAVKRSRMPFNLSSDNKQESMTGRRFEQLVCELRILGHKRMRKHPSIVDILGLCVEEINESPALSLVLEYSSKGNLREFLTQAQPNITAAERCCFILQVAQGLEALHRLRVCHGDVKTENVLMFAENKGWQAKISDFGQSVFASHSDETESVEHPTGTMLLQAPELRKWQIGENRIFSVNDALRTDAFSFGLLLWEVAKHGQRYFETEWIDHESKHVDSFAAEQYLNQLPVNGLLEKGLSFLKTFTAESKIRDKVSVAMEGCLQDVPDRRQCMAHVIDILEDSTTLATSETKISPTHGVIGSLDKLAIQDDTSNSSDESSILDLSFAGLGDLDDHIFSDKIVHWNTMSSFYQLLDYSLLKGEPIIQSLPVSLQQRILADLEALALSECIAHSFRTHAAMTVSECFTVGFGGSLSTVEVVRWLGSAASLGHRKAQFYYHRVCAATGIAPDPEVTASDGLKAEKCLSLVNPDLYLIERIHYFNKVTLEEVRQVAMQRHASRESNVAFSSPTINLSIFNDGQIDEIQPLHVASLLGDDHAVEELVKIGDKNLRSRLGFNAVHFACLSGQLSTLQILLNAGVDVLPAQFRSITPLHLSIFFSCDEVAMAVDLLQDCTSLLDVSTLGEIFWDAHDLTLHGTPMKWAIQARHRAMVNILLPRYPVPDHGWLFGAIGSFYHEILEDIYPRFQDDQNLPNMFTRLQTISRPFAHWIAHGSQHIHDIYQTIRQCNSYGFLGFDEDGTSHLEHIIATATTDDDLVIIEAILSVSRPSYIKSTAARPFASPVIVTAMQVAGNNIAWTGVLKALVKSYALDELENEGFLIEAISCGSTVGCRVLFERGLDVNKNYSPSGILIQSPIHVCIAKSGSDEMLSLLIDQGANILIKDQHTRLNALQWLLNGRMQKDKILEILLRRVQPSEVYIAALHYSLAVQFNEFTSPQRTHNKDPELRGDLQGQFRTLLMHPLFIPYLDTPDKYGRTLIQRAASLLHLPSVRLLLEAGADAGVPFNLGSVSVLPLQMACAQARMLYVAFQGGLDVDDLVNKKRRAHAMEVALELLKWHLTRRDGHFEGITELHLACRMLLEDDVERLTKSREMRQLSSIKGRWPGVEDTVTPYELLKMDMPVEFDIVAQFSVDDSIEGPTQEAEVILDRIYDMYEDEGSDSTDTEDLEY